MAFRDEAAVATYLCNLANELMLVSDKPAAIFKTSEVDPVESLGKMVSVLDAAQESLADVQSRALRHVSYLQVSVYLWDTVFLLVNTTADVLTSQCLGRTNLH
jgi:hypothetical protein